MGKPRLERITVIEFKNTRAGVLTIRHSAWQTVQPSNYDRRK